MPFLPSPSVRIHAGRLVGLRRQTTGARRLRAHARSVIAVLHDLNMTARFCDHIVALKAGAVVFEGTPEALMTPARLHDIYGARMEILRREDGSPVALPA